VNDAARYALRASERMLANESVVKFWTSSTNRKKSRHDGSSWFTRDIAASCNWVVSRLPRRLVDQSIHPLFIFGVPALAVGEHRVGFGILDLTLLMPYW
jgi:hypothetical protein